ADRAQELSVNDDRKRAGIGKIALPRHASFGDRARTDSVHLRLAGGAGVECGASLPECGFGVGLTLAVATDVINNDAELIENDNADAEILAGGFVEAMIAESLGR